MLKYRERGFVQYIIDKHRSDCAEADDGQYPQANEKAFAHIAKVKTLPVLNSLNSSSKCNFYEEGLIDIFQDKREEKFFPLP